MERIGDWCETRTGRRFYPLDPRPEDVDIDDIAWALSNLCRFGGHARQFYCVAEHSVRVMLECPAELRLVGLLHDAAEAYVGDIVAPLKRSLPDFQRVEHGVALAIGERFGLGGVLADLPAAVRRADMRLLATEARDIMLAAHDSWRLPEEPLESPIHPWPAEEARSVFLRRFRSLMGAR